MKLIFSFLITFSSIIKIIFTQHISQNTETYLTNTQTKLQLRYLPQNVICQTSICGTESCNQFGSLCKNNSCQCSAGWSTTPLSTNRCCYKQFSQATAFLYEFFLGFGAGHFYCKRDINGGLKVAFLILVCVGIFALICTRSYNISKINPTNITL